MEEKIIIASSLLEKLENGSEEQKKQAVIELRLLCKWENEMRIAIGAEGGVRLLIPLLSSSDSKIQENAVTALLNLSVYPENRSLIMKESGAVNSIVGVLGTGLTEEAKENSAAAVSSLLIDIKNRDVLGRNTDLVPALLELYRSGTSRGKKDALKALFHLSLAQENKSRVVGAGAIPVLISVLLERRAGIIEDTLAVLAQLARCDEGVQSICDLSVMPLFVEYLKHGSSLAKENSASLFLALCETGGAGIVLDVRKYVLCIAGCLCTMIAVGSPRAKAKASALMRILVVSDSFINSGVETSDVWHSNPSM